jgi:hypothetical protein
MFSFLTRSLPKTGDILLNSKAGQIKNNSASPKMIGTKFYKPSGPLVFEESDLDRDKYLALVEKNATSPEGISPEEVRQIRLYENLYGKTPISRYEHIVKLYRSFIQEYKDISDSSDLSTGRKFLEHLRELNDKIKKIEQAQEFPETPLPPIPKVQEYNGEDVEAAEGEDNSTQVVYPGPVGGGSIPAAQEYNERPQIVIPSEATSSAALPQRTLRNLALGPAMSRLNYNTRRRALVPGVSQRKTRRNGDKKRARNL